MFLRLQPCLSLCVYDKVVESFATVFAGLPGAGGAVGASVSTGQLIT